MAIYQSWQCLYVNPLGRMHFIGNHEDFDLYFCKEMVKILAKWWTLLYHSCQILLWQARCTHKGWMYIRAGRTSLTTGCQPWTSGCWKSSHIVYLFFPYDWNDGLVWKASIDITLQKYIQAALYAAILHQLHYLILDRPRRRRFI